MEVSISEEPPIAPVVVSFADEPGTPASSLPCSASSLQAPASSNCTSRLRRIVAWCVDSSLLLAVLAGHVWIAARLAGEPQYWPDLVLEMPLLWAGLLGCLAIAWSWLFMALCARTPGMALTGQRLRTTHGGTPRPLVAFTRAVLAVLCAAPALFGFVLALFDRRGQTLHDKLSRCVVD